MGRKEGGSVKSSSIIKGSQVIMSSNWWIKKEVLAYDLEI